MKIIKKKHVISQIQFQKIRHQIGYYCWGDVYWDCMYLWYWQMELCYDMVHLQSPQDVKSLVTQSPTCIKLKCWWFYVLHFSTMGARNIDFISSYDFHLLFIFLTGSCRKINIFEFGFYLTLPNLDHFNYTSTNQNQNSLTVVTCRQF